MSTPNEDDAVGPVDPIDRTDGPPVCPRHPARVAYVRCQRCGRPTCPECQRPAAVGVHCVDCVRAATRTAPQRRTVFGAPARGGAPVVTYTILGLTVASFLLQLALDRRWSDALIFVPMWAEQEPYRFVTYALLHSTGGSFGLTHILFNMYALWILGPGLEHAFGRLRFVALYVLSVVGGSVMVLLVASPMDPSWRTAVLGASGGIFGLFGVMLVAQRRIGGDLRGIAIVLGLNLAITFLVPGISWQGHVGGLVTGLALGAVYAYAPKDRRVVLHAAGTAAVVVALAALALLKLSG